MRRLASSDWKGQWEDLWVGQTRIAGVRKVLVALAIAIVVVAAACAARPQRHAHGPIPGMQSPRLLRGVTLRLPTGLATERFTITAPAGLAYDIRIMAPAGSAIAMAMKIPPISTPMLIAPGSGWTLGTSDQAACRASSGRSACVWHFAAGGNPGGAWTAVVRKNTGPAATVEISIVFLKPPTSPGNAIAFAQFKALRLGESWIYVMKQLGAPESRQRVVPYGFTHEEPKGQRCIYYRRRFSDAGERWSTVDTFQLCFRKSRLRYKWAYIAARA